MTGLRVRTALMITAFIGGIYAALGLIYSPGYLDLAVGLIIAALAVTGLALTDWINKP